MSGTPVVRLEGVVALLGSFPALAGIDLSLDSGEVLLIQGPNGAGKTTLLRLCAGLIGLDGGNGTILGCDITHRQGRRSLRRQVGLLGHQSALYDDLTVEQNLEFWGAVNRIEPGAIAGALQRTGLAGRLQHVKVSGLSAGQRRRTSLAVLLCRRPSLWLLDEPHAGLDAAGRALTNDLVVDAAAAGATVMVASHDQEWAKSMASRTVEVVGGQVRS